MIAVAEGPRWVRVAWQGIEVVLFLEEDDPAQLHSVSAEATEREIPPGTMAAARAFVAQRVAA